MMENEEINIERSDREREVFTNLKEFLKEACKCSRGPRDGRCSSQFTEEAVMVNLNNCLELSARELDLVILANIQAVTRVENVGEKRNRSPRCNFLFQSMPVCREMFLMLYGLSYSRFRRLKDHYENNGLSSRTHGNTKRLPQNALPHAVVEDVKVFIANYVEENAISLPGRIPGYKDEDIKLLSSHETKMGVWRPFESACKASEKQAVSYSKNYNKSKEKLKTNEYHKRSLVRAACVRAQLADIKRPIDTQINAIAMRNAQANRAILTYIIDALVSCTKQQIALHEHQDD
ncbi:hypothetical protein AWC38_SpisGene7018 [Stylophora pistillata]|uniref:Uncharacterized protein n=1 Tax=Stylophora pistillata TaxID=50429 RepID=A0A2B4SGP8_STYPI|nr:hypothetical protein AWC38_SpisGene7018 [Stylophora pistillata]